MNEFLTIEEACQYLGVGRAYRYGLFKDYEVQRYRTAGEWATCAGSAQGFWTAVMNLGRNAGPGGFAPTEPGDSGF